MNDEYVTLAHNKNKQHLFETSIIICVEIFFLILVSDPELQISLSRPSHFFFLLALFDPIKSSRQSLSQLLWASLS